MLISISFSVVIYKVLTYEVDRFAQVQRSRIERRIREGVFFPHELQFRNTLPPARIMDPELIDEIKERLIIMLVMVNTAILFASGLLGYLLAGRTLSPIKTMLDEQNRFITDSSHELRTPLTSLKSSMEVNLRDKYLNLKNAKKLISESIEEVNKLHLLTDGLLQLTQYYKPKVSGKFDLLSVKEVIEKAIAKIGPQAAQKSLTIKNEAKDFKIYGSFFGLVDLLTIILDNAVKYTPRNKKITVSSRKSDGFLEIAVSDQGTGIDRKDLPFIFDRFYRSDRSRSKSEVKGYGLGLSIAKRIADIHRGSIAVASNIHKGSIFTIRLPIKSSVNQ